MSDSLRRFLGQLICKQWFLFALLASLVAGHLLADSIPEVLGHSRAKTLIVASVMFAMALSFDSRDFGAAFRAIGAVSIATAINIIILPLMAFGATAFIGDRLDSSVSAGIVLAAIVPSTLASGAVWTRRAGGNDAVAILVTLITNGSCFVVAPLWISMLIGRQTQVNGFEISANLLIVVVIPLVVAQMLRRISKVERFTRSIKNPLSMFCQFGVLAMVLLSTVQLTVGSPSAHGESSVSGESSVTFESWHQWQSIFATILLLTTLHLVAMAVGWFGSYIVGINRRDAIGVSISGSQKTLMVGLKLASDCGVSILPIVAFHTMQLIVDTLIADWWRGAVQPTDERPAKTMLPDSDDSP